MKWWKRLIVLITVWEAVSNSKQIILDKKGKSPKDKQIEDKSNQYNFWNETNVFSSRDEILFLDK